MAELLAAARRPSELAMRVRVHLYAELRRHLPPESNREKGGPAAAPESPPICTLHEGSTVADLIASLGIPAETEIVVGVNGELRGRDHALAGGDEVMLVPPLRGGAGESAAPSRIAAHRPRHIRVGYDAMLEPQLKKESHT